MSCLSVLQTVGARWELSRQIFHGVGFAISDTVSTRPQDPYFLSENKQILRDEIFPYWKGKSVE